ncbi:DUF6602 domain-containing protein [Rhodococcus globerulus]|uniref:DUF6602 domain-containing protein n=1 Tax=Rhodococcus globerulus TaxID=33008 RepID=UPI001C58549C|nr:DUF6602 domain-containing protein [Rhodococcus globerulus]QXW03990.1 hypothetical protein KYT97_08215 [Rhodococcus globerulus]
MTSTGRAEEPRSHEHFEWLAEVSTEIERDYERSRQEFEERGTAATQEVGHHAETAWGRVLGQWLPPNYSIGYRKYLLLEEGDVRKTRETDIVVFHPSYPQALRDRTTVLASGVAAAFSTKRTLDRAGLLEAAEAARLLRRGMKVRSSTLRSEVVPPVFYGVLAHAHAWKSDAKVVEDKISEILIDTDVDSGPRLGLDLVCVANLNCWDRVTMTFTKTMARNAKAAGIEIRPAVKSGLVRSAPLGDGSDGDQMPPISVLIAALLGKLALNDPSINPIADGLRVTGTSGSGSGRLLEYPLHVALSAEVASRLEDRIDSDHDWRACYS